MSEKKLKISLDLDDKAFVQAVKRMQSQLNQINSTPQLLQMQREMSRKMVSLGMGPMPGTSGTTPAQDRQKAKQESDALMRDTLANMHTIKRNESELRKELNSTNTSRERAVKIESELLSIKKEEMRLTGEFAVQKSRETSGRAGIGGNVIKGVGIAASVAATAATFAAQLGTFSARLEGARGSAIQNTAGQDLKDIYSGRAPFEAAWSKERGQASGIAQKQSFWERIKDRTLGLGSIASILGGTAVGGASLLGAPFSAGGTTLGLPVAAGMIGTGVAGLMNDRNRKGVLGGADYEHLMASQQAENFRKNYEALKEQDPGKKLLLEQFEQNKTRDVGIQRSLGLSGAGYRGEGGFLQRGVQAGFGNEQMIGMANQILGAGGSARSGGQAQLGLQMERMGLTNASQILGQLGGSMQSTDSSKNATISIISEAFKIGLDNTQFAEENRKFSEAAASALAKSGATTGADQDRIVSTLSMFMGERTNAGVSAAQGAYERYQERGSQLGGRRGIMRLAEARKDNIFNKLPTQDLVELLGARPDQLREDSSFLRGYATQLSTPEKTVTPQDILSSLGKVQSATRFQIPGRSKEVMGYTKTITDYMSANGLSRQELMEKSRRGELPATVESAMGLTERRLSQENSGGFNVMQNEADLGELVGKGTQEKQYITPQERLEGTGRIEDVYTKKAAEGADEARKNFNAMTGELWKLAEAAKEFVNQVAPAASALHATTQGRTRPTGSSTNQDILSTMYGPPPPASNQTQSGKDRK
jgi:hypothetical protein